MTIDKRSFIKDQISGERYQDHWFSGSCFALKHRFGEAVLTCTHSQCFGQNIFFLMTFSTSTAEKNLCILHGQVFLMPS